MLRAEPAAADLLAEEVAQLEAAVNALLPEGEHEYAAQPALFIISAGVGGLEAADFAKMLLRMYMRFFDRSGLEYEVLEVNATGASGLRNVTLEFSQPGSYGRLIGEAGTHRLTRVSPYGNSDKKQTSFAGVEVIPVLPEVTSEVALTDVRWDTYHSGGHGGQSVNTTDSAVRLTHNPTGLVVTIQGRSQTMNKAKALQVLASRLHQLRAAKQHEELLAARGERKGSWGTQVRTYNLTGISYVKDNRTGHTRRDATRVLDGDLGGFFGQAYSDADRHP